MFAIEIIRAINRDGTNASDVARDKAEHWIRLGVKRALTKALWQIEVELAGAIDEAGISKEARQFLLEEANTSARILKRTTTIENLTASAWHRRGGE